MRIIIFAGGVGSRLWPLSRKNTPKQFGKIIGDKSTLQDAVERLQPAFSPKDIYIATGARYQDVVTEQLAELPKENFIFEPVMRDVGPAIGLTSFLMDKQDPDEPIAIIWSDHMVRNVAAFQNALLSAEALVKNNESNFVFVAQQPRFANQNVGWIELGDKMGDMQGIPYYQFNKLKYRPKLSQAEDFFTNKNYVWNLGYFVTTPRFLTALFKEYVPDMSAKLEKIKQAFGTPHYEKTLGEVYPQMEKISFDDAILEKLSTEKIFVISEDLGWSDIGAWEALKEALAGKVTENVTKGNVMLEDSTDSLVFNYGEQLIVGIDMNEMVIVNTHDVLMVCPKNSVPKIKQFVERLAGTENEHLA